jgi:hypothetical protein
MDSVPCATTTIALSSSQRSHFPFVEKSLEFATSCNPYLTPLVGFSMPNYVATCVDESHRTPTLLIPALPRSESPWR